MDVLARDMASTALFVDTDYSEAEGKKSRRQDRQSRNSSRASGGFIKKTESRNGELLEGRASRELTNEEHSPTENEQVSCQSLLNGILSFLNYSIFKLSFPIIPEEYIIMNSSR